MRFIENMTGVVVVTRTNDARISLGKEIFLREKYQK
jgi:hypothetical protein